MDHDPGPSLHPLQRYSHQPGQQQRVDLCFPMQNLAGNAECQADYLRFYLLIVSFPLGGRRIPQSGTDARPDGVKFPLAGGTSLGFAFLPPGRARGRLAAQPLGFEICKAHRWFRLRVQRG